MIALALPTADIDALALSHLREAGVSRYPVDPVIIANRHGIKVSNAMFTNSRVSGVIRKRSGETKIFVNVEDAPTRMRFTIAHELGHFFLHFRNEQEEVIDEEVNLFRLNNTRLDPKRVKEEREANRFAAALLMPAVWVQNEWERRQSLSDLASAFKVSDEAMLHRLHELRLV